MHRIDRVIPAQLIPQMDAQVPTDGGQGRRAGRVKSDNGDERGRAPLAMSLAAGQNHKRGIQPLMVTCWVLGLRAAPRGNKRAMPAKRDAGLGDGRSMLDS